MPGVTISVVLQDIKKLETDALIVGFYEDVRPLKGLAGELDWLLCGTLSSLILKNKLNGSLGDAALLTSRGKVPAKKIFLIGLGPHERLSPAVLRSAARNAVKIASDAGASEVSLEFIQPAAVSLEEGVRVLHTGLLEGNAKQGMHIALLAKDASVYEKLSQLIKRGPQQRQEIASGPAQPSAY